MKRIVTLLAALITAAGPMGAAEYSRNVRVVSQTPQTAVLESRAATADKKEAAAFAAKSAINTWIFEGLPELNGGQPLADESVRGENTSYFERLFDQDRYLTFLKYGIKEVQKPKKNEAGLWESVVSIELYTGSLERDLRACGVLRAKEGQGAHKATYPSIMVVPYKPEGVSYKEALDEDFDKRMAIAKVQEEFSARGVQTIDFDTKLKAAMRAEDFEYDNATSADAALVKNSGAQVYVTVDMHKSHTATGMPKISLNMQAYDSSTGKVLASSATTMEGRATTAYDKLCAMGVQRVARSFLNELSTNLAGENGGSIDAALRIGIDENATISLDEQADGEDFSVADMIRAWVGKHAIDGKFHQQGVSSTSMIFDSVHIPAVNLDGETQTPADFARRLCKYLKRKDLECTSRIDGNTIYITISD